MRKLVLAVVVLGTALLWLFATRAERSVAADASEDVPQAVDRAVVLSGATSPRRAEPSAEAREPIAEEAAPVSSTRAGATAGAPGSFEFHGVARDALTGLPI